MDGDLAWCGCTYGQSWDCLRTALDDQAGAMTAFARDPATSGESQCAMGTDTGFHECKTSKTASPSTNPYSITCSLFGVSANLARYLRLVIGNPSTNIILR